ncbi:MAG: Asp-tRNA(Asn)/Glu-tRNA(Gln) amidotransferase subunit GatC [Patescibacteria group bacterium]|nr:Asp-tRNA(Asn)/Glu-tRNA(Gln) amidotransferase subunit GatC [Patescibacteria group bacterium]
MINLKEVKNIAELSYINFDEEEIKQYTQELSKIMDFFTVLKKIDTQDVEPLLGSSELEDVTFEDRPKACFNSDSIIERVPEKQDRYIKTRAVFN